MRTLRTAMRNFSNPMISGLALFPRLLPWRSPHWFGGGRRVALATGAGVFSMDRLWLLQPRGRRVFFVQSSRGGRTGGGRRECAPRRTREKDHLGALNKLAGGLVPCNHSAQRYRAGSAVERIVRSCPISKELRRLTNDRYFGRRARDAAGKRGDSPVAGAMLLRRCPAR